MSEFSSYTLEKLIRHHLSQLDGDITFNRITTGKFNTSFFVNVDSKQFVLRIAPPSDAVFVFYEKEMMRQEPEIHEIVLSETDVPVARIIAFDNSQDFINRDFLIMERLPGHTLTEMRSVDYDFVLRQVGDYLAQVHCLTRERYGYLGEHRPMRPQETWVDAFYIMWSKMIDDIVTVGHYDEEESRMMRSLLDQHIALFDRSVPSSLLHMDIWHQNILVDQSGNVTGLVDWDRALWGNPEIEFAVLDYCGISEPTFWEGYGKERNNSKEAQVRQI